MPKIILIRAIMIIVEIVTVKVMITSSKEHAQINAPRVKVNPLFVIGRKDE
jgi:hypothetical protein